MHANIILGRNYNYIQQDNYNFNNIFKEKSMMRFGFNSKLLLLIVPRLFNCTVNSGIASISNSPTIKLN